MKNFFKLIFYLSFLLKASNCFAQNGLYWYFPIKNAIKFDNYPPTIINNSQSTFSIWVGGEGGGTMTDERGNLLYYNNGDTVWNRNNIAMANGADLCSPLASGYSSLSIPFLNDTNRYYIFQSAGFFASTPPNFYNINIVNMSLNGGLGDIEIKNDILYYGSSDRLTATKASNGLDYWLITHTQIGNTWKSFKISCSGIDRNNPVISSIGTSLNGSDYIIYPTIKISSDGRLLATNFTNRGYIELYQFNSASGIISNPIKLISEQLQPQTFEFSPDSKQLYLYSDSPFPTTTSFDQYDVSVFDSLSIKNSMFNIAEENVNFLSTTGQLQTAIDGRIYNATGLQKLSVIENPNVHGIGCSFRREFINIENITSFTLPYTVPSVTTNPNVQISYTVGPDCRTVTLRDRKSVV